MYPSIHLSIHPSIHQSVPATTLALLLHNAMVVRNRYTFVRYWEGFGCYPYTMLYTDATLHPHEAAAAPVMCVVA